MTPDVDQTVRDILEKLRLLDPNGKLTMVDSLSVIDVVQALETALKVKIPSSILEMDYFKSIESLQAFARDLASGEY
ncbi:MAG: phosphopantetheine-binding protein [Polyangia bacterium]